MIFYLKRFSIFSLAFLGLISGFTQWSSKEPQEMPSEEVKAKPIQAVVLPTAEAPPFLKESPQKWSWFKVFEEKKWAVVRIMAVLKPDEGDQERKDFLVIGTGFFFSADGYVLSNAIPLNQAKEVCIEFVGKIYGANIIGWDEASNLCVLKAKEVPQAIKFLELIERKTPLEMGEKLVALSYKLDLNLMPSLGIFSGKTIRTSDKIWPTTVLLSSIPFDPCDWGAPLFDHQGHVLGILIAGIQPARISCFMGIPAICRVVEDLKKEGKFQSASYGLQTDLLCDKKEPNRITLRVTHVEENSSAAAAGLKMGDYITKIGSKEIKFFGDSQDAIFFSRPGERISVEISRAGRVRSFFLTPKKP